MYGVPLLLLPGKEGGLDKEENKKKQAHHRPLPT